MYERAVILNYLRLKPPPVSCPISATTHTVAASDLVPATAVIRAKKRLAAAAAGGAGAGGGDAVDLVDADAD